MGIFTIAAGQSLRMDQFFGDGPTLTLGSLATNSDGTAIYRAFDSSVPPVLLYAIASDAACFVPPLGNPVYPQNLLGDYVLGAVTADFTFTDFTSGTGVVVGTMTGHVWADVTLREYATPVEGGTRYAYDLFIAPESLGSVFPFFMGDDTVTLGAGDDVFYDYGGNLQAVLGDGNDLAMLFEAAGAAKVKFVDAGAGNDSISYQGGNGTILGGAGNDSIGGNGGNDGDWLLDGGAGRDTIEAFNNSRIQDDKGSGNDTYIASWDGTAAFGGTVLSYAGGNRAVVVDLTTGIVAGGGHGIDTVTFIRNVEGTSAGDLMYGIALNGGAGGFAGIRFWGLNGDDTLFGGGAADALYGGRGADAVQGGLGNDSLFAGSGDDLLTGDVGADTMNGGVGADVLQYGDTGESTVARAGRDLIRGFDLSDRFDLSLIDANTASPLRDGFVFVGTDAFTARGQIRYDYVAGNTVVYVNNSGSLQPDMRIDIAGVFDLTEASFGL